MKTENHRRLTALACELAGIEPEYNKLMAEETLKPDVFDDYYITLGGSEVDYYSSRTYLHLYDPVHKYGGAPLQCLRYATLAKDAFNIENVMDGYKYLGWSSHYLEDVGTPVHTDMDVINQIKFHLAYEDWVNLHWEGIENRLFLKLGEMGEPIKSDNIQEHVRNLAFSSNVFIQDIWNAMEENNTEELYNISTTCVYNIVLYTAGFYKYVFTAPEIVEEYELPMSWLSIVGSGVLVGLACYGGYKLLTKRKG